MLVTGNWKVSRLLEERLVLFVTHDTFADLIGCPQKGGAAAAFGRWSIMLGFTLLRAVN